MRLLYLPVTVPSLVQITLLINYEKTEKLSFSFIVSNKKNLAPFQLANYATQLPFSPIQSQSRYLLPQALD